MWQKVESKNVQWKQLCENNCVFFRNVRCEELPQAVSKFRWQMWCCPIFQMSPQFCNIFHFLDVPTNSLDMVKHSAESCAHGRCAFSIASKVSDPEMFKLWLLKWKWWNRYKFLIKYEILANLQKSNNGANLFQISNFFMKTSQPIFFCTNL